MRAVLLLCRKRKETKWKQNPSTTFKALIFHNWEKKEKETCTGSEAGSPMHLQMSMERESSERQEQRSTGFQPEMLAVGPCPTRQKQLMFGLASLSCRRLRSRSRSACLPAARFVYFRRSSTTRALCSQLAGWARYCEKRGGGRHRLRPQRRRRLPRGPWLLAGAAAGPSSSAGSLRSDSVARRCSSRCGSGRACPLVRLNEHGAPVKKCALPPQLVSRGRCCCHGAVGRSLRPRATEDAVCALPIIASS